MKLFSEEEIENEIEYLIVNNKINNNNNINEIKENLKKILNLYKIENYDIEFIINNNNNNIFSSNEIYDILSLNDNEYLLYVKKKNFILENLKNLLKIGIEKNNLNYYINFLENNFEEKFIYFYEVYLKYLIIIYKEKIQKNFLKNFSLLKFNNILNFYKKNNFNEILFRIFPSLENLIKNLLKISNRKCLLKYNKFFNINSKEDLYSNFENFFPDLHKFQNNFFKEDIQIATHLVKYYSILLSLNPIIKDYVFSYYFEYAFIKIKITEIGKKKFNEKNDKFSFFNNLKEIKVKNLFENKIFDFFDDENINNNNKNDDINNNNNNYIFLLISYALKKNYIEIEISLENENKENFDSFISDLILAMSGIANINDYKNIKENDKIKKKIMILREESIRLAVNLENENLLKEFENFLLYYLKDLHEINLIKNCIKKFSFEIDSIFNENNNNNNNFASIYYDKQNNTSTFIIFNNNNKNILYCEEISNLYENYFNLSYEEKNDLMQNFYKIGKELEKFSVNILYLNCNDLNCIKIRNNLENGGYIGNIKFFIRILKKLLKIIFLIKIILFRIIIKIIIIII